MDDQLTINDLPVECIDEILKKITDREHRIYARFVCKLWCALIDQDCSAEKYLIDCEEMYRNPLYRRGLIYDAKSSVDFHKILSMFLNSQRKKTSFHFKVFDFQGRKTFWRMKGAEIISLDLGFRCCNIPLSKIVEHCSKLKSLTFEISYEPDGMSHEEFIMMLEDCISDGKRNDAVHFLYLKYQHLVDINDISNFTRLVSQVFVSVQKVYLEVISSDFDENNNFDHPDNMDLFSTAFENLTYEITLKYREGTIVFDPAGNVPVRMTTLKINKMLSINEILTHLSYYSCKGNHLNRLDVHLKNQHKLGELRKLISQCPLLKSISIKTDSTRFIPLINPLDLNRNNIDYLELSPLIFSPPQSWAIENAFLQFFENLRTFTCNHKLSFSHFVKLLRELPHLEKLHVSHGYVIADPVQTISNEKLLELKIPYLFLNKTIAKYDFINLRELHLRKEYFGKLRDFHPNNVDQDLSRMNCPKLEILNLHIPIRGCWKNHDKVTQRILNILALYPRLIKLLSYRDDIANRSRERNVYTANAADEILKTILKKHRRLREIGWANIESHKLKILSPSHIKHCCCHDSGDVSVLNVP